MSTTRRGIADDDIRTAAEQYLIAYSIDDQPPQELRLGFDTKGRLLEIVVLMLDDEAELVIHAMKPDPSTSTHCPSPRGGPPMTNNKPPPTADGKPVTEETIERLADEAEAGYDTAALRRQGGRKPMGSTAARVIPVRLDPELEQALRARAESDHANASEVIRDALRAWLRSA